MKNDGTGMIIERLKGPKVGKLPAEIVERKGKGHPDSLCDSAVEELSIALCNYYLSEFGKIFHYNVDKCVLAGGSSEVRFGGGEIVKPIYLLIVGRATGQVGGREVPVEGIIAESSKRWLKDSLRFLDVDNHIRVDHRIRAGSSDLIDLFDRTAEVPQANDTSFGAGYAPLSETEQLVYTTETFLNSPDVKQKYPEIGEDVKVMGVRVEDKIDLTVAVAFVSRFLLSLDDYLEAKRNVEKLTLEIAGGITERQLDVKVNTADGADEGSVYMTVSGTSAEGGDDGQVGRGNRVNGLITPYRPMTLEAVAGKNPISHVGKLYNILAAEIARELVKLDGMEEAECYLVSRIGKPITEPQIVNVKLRSELSELELRDHVEAVVSSHLDELPSLWRRVIARRVQLY